MEIRYGLLMLMLVVQCRLVIRDERPFGGFNVGGLE